PQQPLIFIAFSLSLHRKSPSPPLPSTPTYLSLLGFNQGEALTREAKKALGRNEFKDVALILTRRRRSRFFHHRLGLGVAEAGKSFRERGIWTVIWGRWIFKVAADLGAVIWAAAYLGAAVIFLRRLASPSFVALRQIEIHKRNRAPASFLPSD
ncbi:unnamed protein product, partial [Linum tenue]